ncbi:MAG TPA: ATP-binding protein [Candidatus Protoclostridium stercorigallinarum]|uniref:ATP-binding protein n=1 Tax=Candidatus Protoclostridium stercorigallinarum TaxID=2838741 RepID=A0A9D1TRD0_9FIRM|nr:ATP-binding protein [Candidatus Protoclostridium stercorigallinarum]
MKFILDIVTDSGFLFAVQLFLAEWITFSGKRMRKLGVLWSAIGFAATAAISVFWTNAVFYIAHPTLSMLSNIFRYVVLFALAAVAMFATFECSVVETAFFGILGYTMQHMAASVSWLFSLTALRGFVEHNVKLLGLVTIAICVIEYPLVYFLLIRRMYRKRIKLAVISVMIPSSVILAISIVMNMYLTAYRWENPVIEVYHIAFCAIDFFLFASMFDNSRLTEEVEDIENIVDKQKIFGERSKESIDAINIKYHDMKKQLGTIMRMSSSEELAAYGREIAEKTGDYDILANTGNEALNVTFTEYAAKFRELGIKFMYMADGKMLSFMSAADIYSVFGNILDNAAEAAAGLPEELRVVDVRVRAEGGGVLVCAENYYAGGGVKHSEHGGLVTSKRDKDMHGYGTRSIRSVAEKYGGTVNVSADGEMFSLNMFFPGRASPPDR